MRRNAITPSEVRTMTMFRSRSTAALVAGALGLACFAGGCGGSGGDEEVTADTPVEASGDAPPPAVAEAPPAAAPAPAEAAPAPAPAESPVVASAEAPAPAAGDTASAPPTPAATDEPSSTPAPAPAPAAGPVTNAAANDELLKLAMTESQAQAQAAAASAAAATPPAAASSSSPASSGGALGQVSVASPEGEQMRPSGSAPESVAESQPMMTSDTMRREPGASSDLAATSSDSFASSSSSSSEPSTGPTGKEAKLEFHDPFKGATSFLEAVATRDLEQIAQSVALRSETESIPKHREVFKKILSRTLDQESVDRAAVAFKDMKVLGANVAKETAMRGVIVGRTEKNGDQVTYTLEMRKEKAGWKVRDFEGPRVLKHMGQRPRPGQGNQGGSSSSDSGGSSSSDSSGSSSDMLGGSTSTSSPN
jgi:hypothetical protein